MIIGIGGVSRSGKTFLAKILKDFYQESEVNILNQDDYIFHENLIPRIRGEIDWECPESIDFDWFLKDIVRASTISDIVIVEGFLIYYDKRIKDILDRKIYLSISKELYLRRKIHDKRWGDFPDWYMDHIWNSFLIYGKIVKDQEDYFHMDGAAINVTEDLRFYLLG